ncbi:hypothetical protein UZ36_04105 [Candidatus Nitromaritima sp. SCGC AAA799-C22]|nr:hypothetical protein UZ36_04105 [Candidatus Nitromaritima sp. SCGC AAA799-C22]
MDMVVLVEAMNGVHVQHVVFHRDGGSGGFVDSGLGYVQIFQGSAKIFDDGIEMGLAESFIHQGLMGVPHVLPGIVGGSAEGKCQECSLFIFQLAHVRAGKEMFYSVIR